MKRKEADARRQAAVMARQFHLPLTCKATEKQKHGHNKATSENSPQVQTIRVLCSKIRKFTSPSSVRVSVLSTDRPEIAEFDLMLGVDSTGN